MAFRRRQNEVNDNAEAGHESPPANRSTPPSGPRLNRSGTSGGVHDDGYAEEADGGAGQVVAVGFEVVQEDGPGQGAGHEDAAVGGEDAAEVGVGLEGGDEAVGAQGNYSG